MASDGDAERLVVLLEARLSDFETNMAKAAGISKRQWDSIKNDSQRGRRQIESDMQGIGTTLAAGFAGGLGAAALQTGMKAVEGYIEKVRELSKELANVPHQAALTGVSVPQYQALQGAATLNGIDSKSFASGMEGFSKLLNEANRSENSLTQLLDANNVKWKDRTGAVISTNEALSKVAGLMANARSEADKIDIAQMVGLTREWIPLLENGADGLANAQKNARDLGAVLDEETIKRAQDFEQKWSTAWAEWSIKAKASLGGVLKFLQDIIGAADRLIDKVGSFLGYRNFQSEYQEGGAGNVSTFSMEFLRGRMAAGKITAAQVEAAYPGMGARLADAQVPLPPEKALDVTVKPRRKTGTVIPTTKAAASGSEDDADAFSRAEDQARKHIAMLAADTDAVGKNSEVRDRARAVAALEEAAKRANTQAGKEDTAVTKEQRASIEQLADATLAASKKLREAHQQYQAVNEAGSYFGNQGIDLIDSLTQKGANASQIFENLARSIIKASLQASLMGQGPLAGIFGTQNPAGGVGGLLGSLLGLMKGAGAGAAGAPLSILPPGYDIGGYTGPGGAKQPAGIVHKGEVVWSQSDVARAGGPHVVEAMRLGVRGYATGGYVGPDLTPARSAMPNAGSSASPVNVTVINNASGVQATATKDARGNTTISVDEVNKSVEKTLAQRAGRQQGPLAGVLSQQIPRYG